MVTTKNFEFFTFLNKNFLDSAIYWQKGFQDPATPIMEGLINLHHHIFFFLIIIAVFTFWLIFKTIYIFLFKISQIEKHAIFMFDLENFKIFSSEKVRIAKTIAEREGIIVSYLNEYINKFQAKLLDWKYNSLQKKGIVFETYSEKDMKRTLTHFVSKISSFNKYTHDFSLEIIWTVIPTVVLVFIAIPSFIVLYCMDEVINAAITLKIIGHQWYWSYEYSDYFLLFQKNEINEIIFDSYMVPEDELVQGQLRLLEVDNRVVLPKNIHIRLLVTAADVLHSWAVPSFGVKVDAVPGRLNQAAIFIKRSGLFYGQCSEICGVNHGFMPIAVEVVSLSDYISWLKFKLEISD